MVSGGSKVDPPVFQAIVGDRLENEAVAVPPTDENKRNTRRLVGCGHEVPDHKVRIVNTQTL